MPAGQPRSRLHWRADSDRPAPDSDFRLLRHQSDGRSTRCGWVGTAGSSHGSPRVSERTGQSKFGIPNVGPETMPIFQTSTGGQWYFRFPEGETVDVNENASLQDNLSMIRGRHTFKTGYELLRTTHQFASGSSGHREPIAWAARSFLSLPTPATLSHRFCWARSRGPTSPGRWPPGCRSGGAMRSTSRTTGRRPANLTLNLGLRWQTESPYRTKYGQQSQFNPTAIDPLTGRRGALAASHGGACQPRRQQLPASGGHGLQLPAELGVPRRLRRQHARPVDEQSAGELRGIPGYRGHRTGLSGNPDIAFKLSQGPPPINFNIQPDGSAPFIGTNYSGRDGILLRSRHALSVRDELERRRPAAVWKRLPAGIHLSGLVGRWFVEPVGHQCDPPEYLQRSGRSWKASASASQNFRPYPQFGSVLHYSNYGHSSFHSGTVKLEKRMSSGLSFTSFYTWGKSIDEASDDGTASGVTFYNRRLEKGAVQLRRHAPLDHLRDLGSAVRQGEDGS